jgi:hypothetical protein
VQQKTLSRFEIVESRAEAEDTRVRRAFPDSANAWPIVTHLSKNHRIVLLTYLNGFVAMRWKMVEERVYHEAKHFNGAVCLP